MTELIDALEAYTATLHAGRAVDMVPDARARAADDEAASLRAAFASTGVRPTPELLDWFLWHQRQPASAPTVFADITVVSIDDAIRLREKGRLMALEAAADEPEKRDHGVFPDSWFPIGDADPTLIVDTAGSTAVFAIWWDQPPVEIADSLASYVWSQRDRLLPGGDIVRAPDGTLRVRREQIVEPLATFVFRHEQVEASGNTRRNAAKIADAAAAAPAAVVHVESRPPRTFRRGVGLELTHRDLAIQALVDAGVDRRRIVASERTLPPGADHDGRTMHDIAVNLHPPHPTP